MSCNRSRPIVGNMEPHPMRLKLYPSLIALSCVLASGGSALAGQGSSGSTKIYKWTDEHGVMHYGTSIPPQYVDKAATELNRSGVAVKRIDATPSMDQRKASEQRASEIKEEQKRIAEQQRRDNALLSTYTSVREIDDARERNLALPKQAIVSLQPRLQRAQERLAQLQTQVAKIKGSGKVPADSLVEDVDRQAAELQSVKGEIDRQNLQIEQIKKRFESDKQRYVELTQR